MHNFLILHSKLSVFVLVMKERPHTLGKRERLTSKLLIDQLFAGGNGSFPSFPLRVVYRRLDAVEGRADVSVLICVSKKHFKQAVKRNRIKRQIREAYRKHKYLLLDKLAEQSQQLIAAFIWLDDKIHPSEEVDAKVEKLLHYIRERIA